MERINGLQYFMFCMRFLTATQATNHVRPYLVPNWPFLGLCSLSESTMTCIRVFSIRQGSCGKFAAWYLDSTLEAFFRMALSSACKSTR